MPTEGLLGVPTGVPLGVRLERYPREALFNAHRGVERTVEYLRSQLGEEAWEKGMNADILEARILDNPYTYTEYCSASTQQA